MVRAPLVLLDFERRNRYRGCYELRFTSINYGSWDMKCFNSPKLSVPRPVTGSFNIALVLNVQNARLLTQPIADEKPIWVHCPGFFPVTMSWKHCCDSGVWMYDTISHMNPNKQTKIKKKKEGGNLRTILLSLVQHRVYESNRWFSDTQALRI